LPEEIKGKRRKKELKEKAISIGVSLLILVAGLGYGLFNKIKLGLVGNEFIRLSRQHQILADNLASLDIKVYREDLRQKNSLNYAIPYFQILNTLPLSYEIHSFRYSQAGHWNLEAYIFSKEGESFDEIPKVNILKNAVINDYFIKDKPGKRIQVDL
jgi:hypothetical protein